jgi:hypothetical protein
MHIVNTDTSAYGRTADLNFDVGATTNPLAAVSGVYTLYDGGTEGALVMSTSNSGSLAERLRITSDGNVGIGVTSPSSYNAAANNLVISDGGNAGITIVSPSTDSGSLFFADGTSGTAAYAGFVQYGHAAEKLILGTGGTTKVTIDGNGNVGIGTSAPIYAADIKTSGTNNGQLRVGGGSTSATGLLLEQTNSGTTTANIQNSYYATSASASLSIKSGYTTFHTGTSGSERLRIDSNGDVGIGTSTPTNFSTYRYLDIMGSATGTGGVLQLITSDYSVNLNMYSYSAGGVFGTATNHNLAFQTNNSVRMLIDTSGNLLH